VVRWREARCRSDPALAPEALGRSAHSARRSVHGAGALLTAVPNASDDRALALVTLITRLAALAAAVAELHLAQRHAAQAAGARRAAEHLRYSARPLALKTRGATR
jgi:hypothetical protein